MADPMDNGLQVNVKKEKAGPHNISHYKIETLLVIALQNITGEDKEINSELYPTGQVSIL